MINEASMRSEAQPPVPVGTVLTALYVLEAALLLCGVALYKSGDEPLLALLPTRDGLIFAAGLLCGFLAAAYLLWTWLGARGVEVRVLWLTVALNAVTVMFVLVVGETGARLLSSTSRDGTALAGIPLLPRSWDGTRAKNREALARAPGAISYIVADNMLGWTVGPGRRSANGLYASSAEGIRSREPGVVYAGHRPAHRIAVIGDSFAFGEEVSFEDSWARRLEEGLGRGTQVLNFGVDGYGVDQAYLRYMRDVRPWKPDVVIFGFINHDLYRSMTVYTFVSFPEWGYPFAKPRFAVDDGRLELLNTPLIGPEEILERRAPTQLPFITLDRGYEPRDWQWHPYYSSRLARFLLSRFQPAPEPAGAVSDAAMAEVNAALFLSFAETAKNDGAAPLIVYLPSHGDFIGQDRSAKDVMLKLLDEKHIAHGNLTPCLAEVGVAKVFPEGRTHYSAEGNAAVAACLGPAVRARLEARTR